MRRNSVAPPCTTTLRCSHPNGLRSKTSSTLWRTVRSPINHAEVTAPIYVAERLAGVQIRDRLTAARSARYALGSSSMPRAPGWISPRPASSRTDRRACARPRVFTLRASASPSTPWRSNPQSTGDSCLRSPGRGTRGSGTTDTDFTGDPAEAAATAADIEYLIESVSPALPAVRKARRYWACAGVRALVGAGGSASDVTRMHRLVSDIPGLLSVVGGKITGYRAIAEDVTDRVCRTTAGHARLLHA